MPSSMLWYLIILKKCWYLFLWRNFNFTSSNLTCVTVTWPGVTCTIKYSKNRMNTLDISNKQTGIWRRHTVHQFCLFLNVRICCLKHWIRSKLTPSDVSNSIINSLDIRSMSPYTLYWWLASFIETRYAIDWFFLNHSQMRIYVYREVFTYILILNVLESEPTWYRFLHWGFSCIQLNGS